ncbi:MAG TPA: DUF167 domain-containing protein [Bdellovibrionota bacterium]|nr:DUF167 domain-containing protein [Bdellovibrionota bacterium]
MADEGPIREIPGGVRLQLYIQPRSSQNQIAGLMEGRVKIKLTSPPVEGEANKACIAFLSSLLRIPKSKISIIHGERGKRKTVEIMGASRREVANVLNVRLSNV